ncbi:6,7-dimethyl-8-ribityllumazine synthase [Balneolaceae bacterium ANBcel3]|nr:6,7-dimethyl-8-ribityllumazine synthase [Balneolaceae bacterium ANBcel3]
MQINKIEGTFDVKEARIGIVISRWNSFITERLLEGAVDILKRHGVDETAIDAVYCPGSFEIPLVTAKLAEKGTYDAVICLGVVIRGATPHFDYVAGTASRGISDVMLKYNIPIGFGLLTTDSIEQAVERAGTKAGNKGAEAALTVLEMISLNRAISS